MPNIALETLLDQRALRIAQAAGSIPTDVGLAILMRQYVNRLPGTTADSIADDLGLNRDQFGRWNSALLKLARISGEGFTGPPRELRRAIEAVLHRSPIERSKAAELIVTLGISQLPFDVKRLGNALILYPVVGDIWDKSLAMEISSSAMTGRQWVLNKEEVNHDLRPIFDQLVREKRFATVEDCLVLAEERGFATGHREVRTSIVAAGFEPLSDEWFCRRSEFRPASGATRVLTRILAYDANASDQSIEENWRVIGKAGSQEQVPPASVIATFRELQAGIAGQALSTLSH